MKLLKLLASKMDKEEQKCLPLLLNCFYYRETLFIVYELLRDNLYHMYAHAPTAQHTHTSGPGPAVRVNKNNRLNSRLTPCACQLQVHRRVPAAKVLHGEPHSLHQPSEAPCPLPLHPPRRLDETRLLSVEQVERVQEVARQCLSTLVSLHKNGVIHCDLVRHAPIRSLALVRPVHLPCRSPAHSCLFSPVCRNRRTS